MKELGKNFRRRSPTPALLLLAGAAFTLFILIADGSFHHRLRLARWNSPAMEMISAGNLPPPVELRHTVILPDQALLFVKRPASLSFTKVYVTCVYLLPNSSLELPPLSVEDEYEDYQIVRCPIQPRVATMTLSVKPNRQLAPPLRIRRWDYLAYQAMIDRDNTTIVFVKGLNLRSGKSADPSKFKCVYGWDFDESKIVLQSNVVSVAQEIVRCATPLSVLNNPRRSEPSGPKFDDSIKVSVRMVGRKTVPSIARVDSRLNRDQSTLKQHEMCVCTMLRNQGLFLHEWVEYHARIGVQRWFIYDNNSDDDTKSVIERLMSAGHNVTRHFWPWVKSQEAGFAHCALTARDSCRWVGFIDVDEFLHMPDGTSLLDIVRSQSRLSDVAELRVTCHSFGPSGLTEIPKKGVVASYTCRLAAPERHKSIVKPEGLNASLINLVHHFHLKPGFRHVSMNSHTLVINHYKYQVWEVFKEKFYRRVATYVSDWQQERNVGSKDRAPGLGTKAVEPSDWSTRFCEVKDTSLRDQILETFTDPDTGRLPWEDHQMKT